MLLELLVVQQALMLRMLWLLAVILLSPLLTEQRLAIRPLPMKEARLLSVMTKVIYLGILLHGNKKLRVRMENTMMPTVLKLPKTNMRL